MPHLIRGILDGDGSIAARMEKQNVERNRFIHSISFCGSHQLMTDISNYLYTHLELAQKPSVYDYKDRQLSDIKIRNILDMKKLGDWLYNNSTIFLKRKKDAYNNFLQHYNFINKE